MKASRVYQVERRRSLRGRMVAACVLATVLVPAFGAVDYFLYPAHFTALMTTRAVSGVIGVLLLLLLRTRFGAHHPTWIAGALVVQAAVAIAIVPVYLTGTDTPHYVSTSLLLLSVTALLPWTPLQTALLTVILSLLFVAAGILHGSPVNAAAFATQVSAILISGMLGSIITVLAQGTRWRELIARRGLRTASREKTGLIRHLEHMATRLATVNEDLYERQRETNDFLYVLSHDLRAPLINIQGFSKRLDSDMSILAATLEDAGGEGTARRLARMKQSLQFLDAGTTKIDQLISRLLEIARLTTRPGKEEWVDSQRMAHDVFASCKYQLEAAGIDHSVGELPHVWADTVQLNQVLTNLVDNAIKYMGHVPRKHIAITCSGQGDRFRFAVRDTGPGIAPKDQEKIFRLFARAAANGNDGEGVGLATVRAIVNRHGGRIWVESTPGEGSTFYFTLPRKPTEAETVAASAKYSRTPGAGGEESVHVH